MPKSYLFLSFLAVSVVLGTHHFTSPVVAQEKEPVPTSTTTKKSTTSEIKLPATAPETGINLTLSPTFITVSTDPGKPVSSMMKITNNNNFREYLRIDIAKFEAAESGDRPLISEMGKDDVYKDWVHFDQNQFTLDPNETKSIRFTISPPEDASLGYYYAFMVNRMREKEEQAQGAVISGSPALLTLLEVKSPHAKRELQLVKFEPEQLFYEYLPTTFRVTIKNTGNIHIAPSGDIFIDSMRNKNIAAIRANEGRSNILPNTQRDYTTSWSDAFALKVPKEENGRLVRDDKGNVVYTVKYDFTKADKFRIGKYTAHLIMFYDNGEKDIPLEATASFWVIPVRMILAVLAIIITPAVVVYFFMKWRYGKRR